MAPSQHTVETGLQSSNWTHCPVSSTRQNPEVRHFGVEFQPAENKRGRYTHTQHKRFIPNSDQCSETEPGWRRHILVSPGLRGGDWGRCPGSVWVNSPLAGSSFSQVKHLPRVQIPHERLNDLGSLRTHKHRSVSAWRRLFLRRENPVLLLFSVV